jgi:CRISPR-associated protein Csb2
MGAPGRNTNAIFRVVSDNPPPVTEALSIAETARKKLMGISRALLNEGNRVSPTFSGKNTDGSPMEGHLHAFIISYSSSSGKYIDTLVIRSDNGFGTHEVSCILHLNTLLIPSLGEVEFELEALLSEPPAVSKIWVSATPFITARHHRTSRGEWRSWMENEMQNELRLHGMDTPERVTAINSCSARNLSDFKRTRKNGIMNNFAAFRLEFSKPQKGPFSIGALCHFGLGTFIPEE